MWKNLAAGLWSSASGRVGLIAMIGWLALAIVAPMVIGLQAEALDVPRASQGPSGAHLLGTDSLGRDVLARTLVATRLSLIMAVSASAIAVVIGSLLGAGVALVTSPRLRGVLLRAIDGMLAFPALLLALLVVTIVGTGVVGAVIAIGVAVVPQYARMVSTLSLSTAGRDYMSAARMVGVGRTRLLARHLLPNIAEPIVITTSVVLATSLVWLSALSFLGLGVQPPQSDWGTLLDEGLQFLYVNPTAALAPAAAIVFLGVAAGLLGEAGARAFNPMLWTGVPAGGRRRVARFGSRTNDDPSPQERNEPRSGCEADPALLELNGLSVAFDDGRGATTSAVTDVSLTIGRGEIVGLVGESGSGKSLTALSLAQLTPVAATVEVRSLRWRGQELTGLPERARRRLLGTQIAMVFQDPGTALNPAMRIGAQLTETLRPRTRSTHRAARLLAERRLTEVNVSAPARRLRQYPHELSGGMRQRVMIAMGLMVQPALIIADEPTTALDVTVQGQILDVLREAHTRHGTAILFISHDIGVVAELCDRILVMYAGRIVEDAPTSQLLHQPRHPYTRALLAAVPDLAVDRAMALMTIPGAPPTPGTVMPGCPYRPRCGHADVRCETQPELVALSGSGSVACWAAEPRT